MRLCGRPASRHTAAIFFRFWKYIYRNALLLEEYVDSDFYRFLHVFWEAKLPMLQKEPLEESMLSFSLCVAVASRSRDCSSEIKM